MVFGSPKQRSLLEGVTWDQAFAYATDTFRRAMPGIAAQNVSLCMEPLGPSETDFINTASEGARLMEAVGHPNFVLHLDVKAMSSEPTPVPDIIRQYANRTGHFHANDPNRRGPGFGDVDFVPIFRALKESGYDRWVSVEVFDYTPDPETIAEKSIEYMRNVLNATGGASVDSRGIAEFTKTNYQIRTQRTRHRRATFWRDPHQQAPNRDSGLSKCTRRILGADRETHTVGDGLPLLAPR